MPCVLSYANARRQIFIHSEDKSEISIGEKTLFFHATVSLIWTLTEKTFNSYLGEEARVGVKDHAARACSFVLSEPDS